MRKLAPIILLLFLGCSFTTESQQSLSDVEIQRLVGFAKLYGYVKYFHPSDEAAVIDWNKFAIYGTRELLKVRSQKEYELTLEKLFRPIAPSIEFLSNEEVPKFATSKWTPPDTFNYEITYWQHQGVSFGMNSGYQDPYESIRVNSYVPIESKMAFGRIMMKVDASKLKNKRVKYTAWAKLNGVKDSKSYLRLLVHKTDGTTDLVGEPIIGNEWKEYMITETIDSLAHTIEIGIAHKNNGSVILDDAKVAFQEDNDWINIPIANGGFESSTNGKEIFRGDWRFEGEGYSLEITSTEAYQQNKAALIRQDKFSGVKKSQPLFDKMPGLDETTLLEFDSFVVKIPLVLYTNENGTYPPGNSAKLNELQTILDGIDSTSFDRILVLSNVIITYNVFQHFFPYMDILNLNWEAIFREKLLEASLNSSRKDHRITLEQMTAPLKDGHISIADKYFEEHYQPRISWSWIENELVITSVRDSHIPLQVGDIVSHVNGQKAIDFYQGFFSKISAGTEGYLKYRANKISLQGAYNSKFNVTVNGEKIDLIRNVAIYSIPLRQAKHQTINDEIHYVNISKIEMDEIRNLLPELENKDAIIFDLRGYPNRNHGLIRHLLKENDTTQAWMQVPQFIYPDQTNVAGFSNHNWLLPALKPHLGDKQLFFLTNGRAISYAESYMGYIDGYDLATIIGEPTAGTNGNINKFNLPGDFDITWTGMKVTKHDGSMLHGVGIVPDFIIEPTIEGLKQGKDEVLEFAIELAKKE